LGLRVKDLEFRMYGLEFGVKSLGLRFKVQSSGLRV